MKKTPLLRFELPDKFKVVSLINADENSFNMSLKILTEIHNIEDEAICDAVLRYAEENHFTDVFILDKKFVENALKKQIPQKPREEIVIANTLKFRYCPACNVRFIQYGMKHCAECGQALNWGESEQEEDNGKAD